MCVGRSRAAPTDSGWRVQLEPAGLLQASVVLLAIQMTDLMGSRDENKVYGAE